jgi:TfoX/Sxy family transcriptional regulator of competence genes
LTGEIEAHEPRRTVYRRPVAYDRQLATRVEMALVGRDRLSERKMFGGIGFMIGGNMAVGVIGEELIVRLTPSDAEKALAERGVRQFDFTGRPMRGWIFVASTVLAREEALSGWVDAGADHAASMPVKRQAR